MEIVNFCIGITAIVVAIHFGKKQTKLALEQIKITEEQNKINKAVKDIEIKIEQSNQIKKVGIMDMNMGPHSKIENATITNFEK